MTFVINVLRSPFRFSPENTELLTTLGLLFLQVGEVACSPFCDLICTFKPKSNNNILFSPSSSGSTRKHLSILGMPSLLTPTIIRYAGLWHNIFKFKLKFPAEHLKAALRFFSFTAVHSKRKVNRTQMFQSDSRHVLFQSVHLPLIYL